MEEKIKFYLMFAKTKLDIKCSKHKKAREEIDNIIAQIEKEKACK